MVMRALRLENKLLTTNALAYFTRKSVTMEKNGKALTSVVNLFKSNALTNWTLIYKS
jgi:hypothetical protein